MQPNTIIVVVNEQGEVKTDFQQFAGASCVAEGQQLHTLLARFGIQTEQISMTPKPELLAALREQQAHASLEQEQEGVSWQP